MSRARPTLGELVRLALLALFFTTAATAGDIGGCGQPENDLDPGKFFATKQSIDCQRCQECQISTRLCERSCDVGGGGLGAAADGHGRRGRRVQRRRHHQIKLGGQLPIQFPGQIHNRTSAFHDFISKERRGRHPGRDEHPRRG